MDATIDSLLISVEAPATEATKGLNDLANTLGILKNATKGIGLNGVTKQVTDLNIALISFSAENAAKLKQFALGLRAFDGIKISSSIATQISNIGGAVQSLNGTDFSVLGSLGEALTPLSTIGKSNLNSFISQLKRLPEAAQALDSIKLDSFKAQIEELSAALNPLATQMQAIANGFAAFPTKLQRIIKNTSSLTTANERATKSYINFAAKITITVVALRRILDVIGRLITKSNDHLENLNLFSVSMGEYAAEAQKYAETVGEVMGIDPSEWMRNQGMFMTMATGFGVLSDRAYIMSQNLTQLGYDLSSLFNLSFSEAMQKLQSGLAGELEPLRALGYDLSQAKLESIALSLGIDKAVSSMTQAEKAELRYYAIMTQVTQAQGDMARTLSAPANQLRILQSAVSQAARALGNVFIPALNAVLPYAIALANVVRTLANAIAGLFGFSLPSIDYSGIGTAAGGVADATDAIDDNLGGAGKKAKALKNALLGIDELNVLSRDEDSSGSGGGSGFGGGGGGFDFELPTYDFIGDAVNSKVNEITQRLKDWLGLTEEIDTWSELFHTRLGRILTTIGSIGLGFAAWKISKKLLDGLTLLQNLKKLGLTKPFTISMGVTLAVTGIALEASGIIDAIKHELNRLNFAQIVSGGGLIVSGGALIGKAFGKAILGGGIGAVVAGIPAFITGIYDSVKNDIDWLSASLTAIGSTAAGAGIGAIIGSCGGPITAGIGALIGLAVGLVTDGIILIIQKWDVITAFIEEFFTVTVPGLWGRFTTWLQTIPAELGRFFKSLPKKISAWFSDLWEPIRTYDWNGLGYNIGQWFGNAWKTAVDFVTVKIPTWFGNVWKEIENSCKKFFTVTLPKFFNQTLPDVISKVADFFKQLPGKIYNAFLTAKQTIVEIGKAIIDGIWEGLQTVWQAIKDFVSGFVDGFKDALGIHSPSTVFRAIGEDIVSGLLLGIERFTDMMGTVQHWGSSVVEWFVRGEDGKNIVDHFKEIGGNIIGGFRDKITNSYGGAKPSVTTWGAGVKDWFTNNSFGGVNRETFATFANNTIEGFKSKIAAAFINSKSAVTTWAYNVKDWYTSSSFGGVNFSNFATYANNIIEGFRSKISAAYVNVRSAITTWAGDVKNRFTGSSFGAVNSSTFETYAQNVVSGFATTISNRYTDAQSPMTSFANSVLNWFRNPNGYSLVTSFKDIGENIIQGFIDGISNLWKTATDKIYAFGQAVIRRGKEGTDEASPSKAFKKIGAFVIEGFNIGLDETMPSTFKIMNEWLAGVNDFAPTVGVRFTVDTSALKYYGSQDFTRAVTANIKANGTYTMDPATIRQEFRAAMLEALNESGLVADMRRQADKQEQTNVYIGNRTVTDAVTTQQRANGYRFVTA